MIVNKVLIQRIIISLTSDLTVYIPQSGLDDGQKDDFCGSLIMSLECQGRTKFQLQQETLMVTGNKPENYQEQHEGYGYGIRKKEEESIHEFCEAMDMTLEKALFKKSVSH